MFNNPATAEWNMVQPAEVECEISLISDVIFWRNKLTEMVQGVSEGYFDKVNPELYTRIREVRDAMDRRIYGDTMRDNYNGRP